MSAILVWVIAFGSIAGVIFRPRRWPEAAWACLGAGLLVLLNLIALHDASGAVGKGWDVYLFLTGMMILAELARKEGVFDWLAGVAVQQARGSRARLFGSIFGVGVLVTVFLSNDATAVVLTPAVYAAVKRARTEALPYLFACAFIANAASFALPISNPANLVVYGSSLPPLGAWLRVFALPSLLSITATFLALRWNCRKALAGELGPAGAGVPLSNGGRRAAWGILGTGGVLIASSAMGWSLGPPTLAAGVMALLWARGLTRLGEVLKDISWSVLPLVAGLFVLVEALNQTGAARELGHLLLQLERLPEGIALLAAAFGVTALSNVMNNLPSGLMTGSAVKLVHVSANLRDALLIGVDLGPNLSVTGSLATMLWLTAIRREGEDVTGWTFLKMGALVMTPALLFATLALLV